MKLSTSLLVTCILGLTTFACAAPPVAEKKGSTSSHETKSAQEIIDALTPKTPSQPLTSDQQQWLDQLRKDEAARAARNKRSDNESDDDGSGTAPATNVAADENQTPVNTADGSGCDCDTCDCSDVETG